MTDVTQERNGWVDYKSRYFMTVLINWEGKDSIHLLYISGNLWHGTYRSNCHLTTHLWNAHIPLTPTVRSYYLYIDFKNLLIFQSYSLFMYSVHSCKYIKYTQFSIRDIISFKKVHWEQATETTSASSHRLQFLTSSAEYSQYFF